MKLESIATFKAQLSSLDDLGAAFDAIRPELPYGDAARAVVSFLVSPSATCPQVPLARADYPLYDNLEALKAIVDWTTYRVRSDTRRAHIVSPASDELLTTVYPQHWTSFYLLNHLLLSLIKPTKHAAVVVAMRNDGIRVLEWIAHYMVSGFEGIFVYTNNNDDSSTALLECLANSGIITLIDNQVSGSVSPQQKGFEHSLRVLPELRDYEWVLYADSDEFLALPSQYDHKITDVLVAVRDRYGETMPSAILYHWKWFVSGNRFGQSPLPLIEAFCHSTPHQAFKSLVHLADTLSMVVLHFPLTEPEKFFVDSSLMPIKESTQPDKISLWQWKTSEYSGGQLNHYWHKSFIEYALKKRRGDTVQSDAYSYKFDYFFDWNSPETASNVDNPSEVLIGRVYRQIYMLRLLPGVVDHEQDVKAAHSRLLDYYGGEAGLKEIYTRQLASKGLDGQA